MTERDDDLERMARIVVDCGYRLHRDLGPGLLESAYEAILTEALRASGLEVRRQVPIAITFEGLVVENAFKADMLVEGRLLVELKSVERAAPVHAKQVLTYLRLMDIPLGLLINFGMATYKEGIQRIANDYHSGWTRT
jgi:GxxExxY protein